MKVTFEFDDTAENFDVFQYRQYQAAEGMAQ